MPLLPPAPPATAAASVPLPPPVRDGRVLLAWLPGEVRCAGAVVVATPMRRPWTSIGWSGSGPAPVTYSFSIDAAGRTTGIRREGAGEYVAGGEDIAPSLAATRFPAGGAQGRCLVTYVPRRTPFADTPVADLMSYTVTPLSGTLPEEGWARIGAAGNCAAAPRPDPLLAAFPDYRALPGTPGVKDWALVGYDLDPGGRPRGVHVVAGTGNGALDAAAATAMARARFTAGSARHGCLHPYSKAPVTLAPPPAPEEEAFRPAGATCPAHHDWSVYPTLTYPEPWRRRAIEGWAMVVYDVAPWGEVGNARVVAAEPSDEFGKQALAVVRSGRVPTTDGLVGCVDRVRFRMPGSGEAGVVGTGRRPGYG